MERSLKYKYASIHIKTHVCTCNYEELESEVTMVENTYFSFSSMNRAQLMEGNANLSIFTLMVSTKNVLSVLNSRTFFKEMQI